MSRAILSVGIHGASGRMGTRLIQLIAEDAQAETGRGLGAGRPPRYRPRCCRSVWPGQVGGLAFADSAGRVGDRRHDRLLTAAGRARDHRMLSRAEDSPGRRHDRPGPDRAARPGTGRDPDPDPDRAQHEPGRQSADETGGRGRPFAGRVGRHRDHRDGITRPRKMLPAGRPFAWPSSRARESTTAGSSPVTPAMQNGSGPARSPSTPSGSPIVRASTPLSSACPGKPWN